MNQSSGDSLSSMFFYNSNKLKLKSQTEITTDLRDVNVYHMYANDPNLASHNDTIFINYYAAHLKAGSDASDKDQRKLEVDSIRKYVDSLPSDINHILGGDFNFKTSSEKGYQALISGGVDPFIDPIDRPGDWNANSSFSDIHTQSTRKSTDIECGATGGLDDRFDLIHTTDNIMNGTDSVEYIDSTYRTPGNDDQHFDESIISSPQNTSAPDSVIDALYYMSDHLPVVMDVSVRFPFTDTLSLSYTKTDNDCAGDSLGSIDLSVSGGSTPYSYSWSNGDTTQDIDSLASGTYEVIVTDADTTKDSVSVTIQEPMVLTSSAFADSTSCYGSCDGRAYVSASGGTSPYTYQWDDPNLQTGDTASSLCAGTYTVVVTDDNGCTDTSSVTVHQPDSITFDYTVYDDTCGKCVGAINISNVSGGTSPYDYTWSDGSSNQDRLNVCDGTYSLVITDDNGCTVTVTIIVGEVNGPSSMSYDIQDETCGNSNGSVAITGVTGGTTPYEYSFAGSAYSTDTSYNSLSAGTYSVKVKDSNGCIYSDSVTVNNIAGPSNISFNITDDTCGNSSGEVEITGVTGGTSPYEYSFNGNAFDTNTVYSSLSADTFSVTVKDDSGCTYSESVIVNEIPGMKIDSTFVVEEISCAGNSDGVVAVDASSGTTPYAYEWKDTSGSIIAADDTAEGLSEGTYCVTVTDANGCTASDCITLNEPSPLSIDSTTVKNVTCNGDCDGEITVSVSGGTTPYNYTWNDPAAQTGTTASGLCANKYCVDVTDANGCTITICDTVKEPAAIDISTSVQNANCGQNDGKISISSISGGSGSYTSYEWDSAGTVIDSGTSADSLYSGAYCVTVTDDSGCTATECDTVENITSLSAAVDSVKDATCSGLC
ncbi:MAG: hypothetical protein ABEH43_04760, partial [Flavobacteriales bacterium]